MEASDEARKPVRKFPDRNKNLTQFDREMITHARTKTPVYLYFFPSAIHRAEEGEYLECTITVVDRYFLKVLTHPAQSREIWLQKGAIFGVEKVEE